MSPQHMFMIPMMHNLDINKEIYIANENINNYEVIHSLILYDLPFLQNGLKTLLSLLC